VAVSAELVNTQLEDLRGPLELIFTRNSPLHARLRAKGQTEFNGGTYVTAPVSTGAPSQGTGLYNGDEPLDLTRLKKLKKYEVELHRVAIPIVIPGKEAAVATGKRGALKLIKEYPKAVAEAWPIDWNKYTLTGTSEGLVLATTEMLGFACFNGQFNTGIGRGITNGFLSFQTPAAQIANVQNIAKSQSDGHYNQFDDIGSWATNNEGIKTWKKVYRACAQHSGKPGLGPDLVICDDDTYGNFEDEKYANVRIKLTGDKVEGDAIENVFYNASVYPDPAIVLALFTGVANDGVTYMLTTDHIEEVVAEDWHITDFVDKLATQDGLIAKAIYHGNLFFRRFPSQGVVSGGAA